MKLSKQVAHGEIVEWYYGYGYRNYQNLTIVVYIIPFNLFVQVGRFLYFKLRNRHFEKDSEKFDVTYKQGFEAGKRIGIKEGEEMAIKKKSKPLFLEVYSTEISLSNESTGRNNCLWQLGKTANEQSVETLQFIRDILK